MTVIGGSAGRRSITLPGHDPETSPRVVELVWAAATDVGLRRRHNEDSLIAEPPVFAVADGMGGHSAGDLASAAVVQRLEALAEASFGGPYEIRRALHDATRDIAEVADDEHLGVGTTATGAVLMFDPEKSAAQWLIFNVGDSRVYIADGAALVQVTVDHSVVQEMVAAGMLDADAAEAHPDSNIITRAVGFNAEPDPDYWAVPVIEGMRLLVCSDGLTREVDVEGIAEILGANPDPSGAVQALVAEAVERGGRDNVTVVVVDVVAAPALAPEPGGEGRPAKVTSGDVVDDEVDDDTAPTRIIGRSEGRPAGEAEDSPEGDARE